MPESQHPTTSPNGRGVVNVASVPHRSPFRYPGGKTWLVPWARDWVRSLDDPPTTLCEPFCGGAIVGLSMLFEGLVDRLVLVELDKDVASVWQTILYGDADTLIQRIAAFEVTHESVREALRAPQESLTDRAFATILRNRVNRGGILAPGASLMKRGENGKGLRSRWYPATLASRIRAIAERRDRIDFHQCDGLAFMQTRRDDAHTAWFIDPPYTVAGRRLYRYSELDHGRLFEVASGLAGPTLITYDDTEEIRSLAEAACLDCHVVPMKNTHNRVMGELLMGRDVSWARGRAVASTPPP